MPKEPLDIDKFVERLAKHPRKPKLRPLEEFSDDVHLLRCPYGLARAYLCHAVNSAEAEVHHGPLLHKQTRDALELSREHEKTLQEMISAQRGQPFCSKDSGEILERALESLRLRIERLEHSTFVNRSKGDVWKLTFVHVLALAWVDLTSSIPTTSRGGIHFSDFVETAYRTLDDKSEQSWDRQVRTVIERESKRPLSERWNVQAMIRECFACSVDFQNVR